MRALCCLLALLFAAPAWSQDDLDDFPEAGAGDTPGEALPESPSEEEDDLGLEGAEDPDALAPEDLGDPEDDLDFTDESDEDEDLFGDEEPADSSQGGDSAAIFSAKVEELEGASPEERSAAWEAYLQEFPDTVFRERIAQLQQAALDELYGEQIYDEDGGKKAKREVLLTESILLDNINPATRVKIGFDWGIPDWINFIADAEYALTKNLSVHGGARKRYTGWSIEPGARLAFLKSKEHQYIATLLGDVRFNADPAFFGFRPQLGFGKKFGKKLDLQIQGGAEINSADGFWTQAVIGGGNATYRASTGVALYVEGSFYAKYLNWPSGNLHFHVVGFGMKFYPGQKKDEAAADPMEVTFGASVPWSYYPIPNWQYHQGSVIGQGTFYLED